MLVLSTCFSVHHDGKLVAYLLCLTLLQRSDDLLRSSQSVVSSTICLERALVEAMAIVFLTFSVVHFISSSALSSLWGRFRSLVSLWRRDSLGAIYLVAASSRWKRPDVRSAYQAFRSLDGWTLLFSSQSPLARRASQILALTISQSEPFWFAVNCLAFA